MIDEWMDEAISSYSAAEPVAGLEERVLSRIRTAEAGRRRLRWMKWTLAIPALAAVCIGVIPVPPEQRLDPAPLRFASAPALIALRKSAPMIRRPMLIAGPVPITEQERALLALARSEPAAALQAFADLRKKSNELIEIEPITIPPLESDGNPNP